MGFFDKVKSAAKEAWQESREEGALERDEATLEDERAALAETARRVLAPGEEVLLGLVQGGGGRVEGDTVGKLLSAANEAANPTVDVERDGEGAAADWPAGSNRLVLLTDKRLRVFPRSELLREEDCEAAWWVHDVAELDGDRGLGGGRLEVTFEDGSVVRVPVAGRAEHVAELWRTRPAAGARPDLDPATYD